MPGKDQEIQTVVILYLDTIGHPREYGEKCSIKEFSLCAFSAQNLIDKDDYSKLDLNNVSSVEIPELPPVLNKITLMMHPSDVNNDGFEEETGKFFKVKNYEMLQNESSFDKVKADCINNFLGRLKKPICLVAHNGWEDDFPTIHYIYEKINKAFPSGIFCVDSLKAFREIDKKYENIKKEIEVPIKTGDQTLNDKLLDGMRAIVDSSQINWQEINEATPCKKPKVSEINEASPSNNPKAIDRMKSSQETNLTEKLRVKRELFVDDELTLEKLENIYRRCFGCEPLNLHRCDVLTRLILYYGTDFVAYAEEHKILFADVPKPPKITN